MLVVGKEESAIQVVADLLSHNGYAVTRALDGRAGLEQARREPPDAVAIAADLPDGSGSDFCARLRNAAEIGHTVPLVMLTAGPAARRARLAALQAGAWDVLTSPPDREELLHKFANFTDAKLATDRHQRDCLVDFPTGLYSFRGLERRGDEVRSQAYRDSKALSCVVFSAIPKGLAEEHGPTAEPPELSAEIVTQIAAILREVGRLSDVIGRSGKSEFAVVAPSTSVDGAIKLAERLANEIRVRANGEQAGFDLRAGYDSVTNVREHPVEARDLLLRATLALRRALSRRNGWLEGFE